MKLEDKAIDKIIAMFDEEIAELEREAHGIAAAEGEQPSAEIEAVVDEEPDAVDKVVDEVQPDSENDSVVDEELPEDLSEEPADEEPNAEPEPETEDVPTDEDTSVAEPAADSKPAENSMLKSILGGIGYLLAVAAICVLSVVAVNLLDNSIHKNQAIAPPDVAQSNLAASLQTYTTNEVFAQQAVAQPSLDQIYGMDLRTPSGATEADLKKVSRGALVGLEDTFLEAEKKYGVNAIFLMSIASLESAYGTICYRPNNMFGYGGKSYPSKEACIMDVAYGLSSRYLNPSGSLYGGSPTLSGVNKRYAANPQWYAKVGKYMKGYYDVIAPYHNQILNKLK